MHSCYRIVHHCRKETLAPRFAESFCKRTHSSNIYDDAGALLGPRAPLGAPVRKPFLARRPIVLRKRHRPEPVVFLRLAFSLQLSARHGQRPTLQDWASDVHFRMLAAGYPQAEHVCFWMWRDRRPGANQLMLCSHVEVKDAPQRRQRVCVLLWRLPKLDVPFAVGLLAGRVSFAERAQRTHRE
jgi:hypothetical protein